MGLLPKDALLNRSRAEISAEIPSAYSAQELNSHNSVQTIKAALAELDQITLLK
jgi:hypothetical protein